ncbi:MAG: aminotransferase class V-fold PLP-dependent enzyme [Elusimicrobia bacterium]|nr:aminotransferase class V-fold PLP-dependent enzyme [Elusimicrobiota bacterium]
MSRYDRQTIFAPIGQAGQAALRASTVSIVGLGALGCASSTLLARSGVGRLRLYDRDFVELDNLQRQVLYDESDVAGLSRAAHDAGAAILVDAAQAVGAADIDVGGAGLDMVAFPCHKGLFGPMGTGALYVRPGLDLRPLREGGTGARGEDETHPEEMPYRLEAGTPNAHGLAGLAAGLAFLRETGIQRVRERERSLALAFFVSGGDPRLRDVRARFPQVRRRRARDFLHEQPRAIRNRGQPRGRLHHHGHLLAFLAGHLRGMGQDGHGWTAAGPRPAGRGPERRRHLQPVRGGRFGHAGP